jgi:hypothetical protein
MNSDVISESSNIDLLAKACLIGFGFQDLDRPPSVGRPILFLSAKLVDRKQVPPARAELRGIELADQLNWCEARTRIVGPKAMPSPAVFMLTAKLRAPKSGRFACCRGVGIASPHSTSRSGKTL